MATLHVIKDGKSKLTIPYTLTNGFPNFNGTYLVSKEACAVDGVDPKTLVKKTPTQTTGKYYLRMGINPDGNELIDDDDLATRKEAMRKQEETIRRASLTPEQRGREDRIVAGLRAHQEIEQLRYLSDKALTRDTDEENVSRGYRLSAQADAKEIEWKQKHPEAAAHLKARSLRAQAADARKLAAGAMTYDADGWIDRDEQQKRHDAEMARAAELEVAAAELENK